MEILESVRKCIDGALKAVEEKGMNVRIVAVGITNQRETTLVWDRSSGQPLHNAIVWFDSRTAAICRRFRDKLGSSVRLAVAPHHHPFVSLDKPAQDC